MFQTSTAQQQKKSKECKGRSKTTGQKTLKVRYHDRDDGIQAGRRKEKIQNEEIVSEGSREDGSKEDEVEDEIEGNK